MSVDAPAAPTPSTPYVARPRRGTASVGSVVRTELYKQLRRPRTYTAYGLMALIPVIMTVALKANPARPRRRRRVPPATGLAFGTVHPGRGAPVHERVHARDRRRDLRWRGDRGRGVVGQPALPPDAPDLTRPPVHRQADRGGDRRVPRRRRRRGRRARRRRDCVRAAPDRRSLRISRSRSSSRSAPPMCCCGSRSRCASSRGRS